MIKAETICGKCGRVDEVIRPMLKKMIAYDSIGQELELLYYTCPQCRADVVVQIDNESTKGLLNGCLGIVQMAMKNGRKGQKTSQKRQKKYSRLSESLRAERKKLMDLYDHSELYDKQGNVLIKELTILGGGDIIESKM